jgi:Zn-dependent membrane protease YugP
LLPVLLVVVDFGMSFSYLMVERGVNVNDVVFLVKGYNFVAVFVLVDIFTVIDAPEIAY